jgi:hypothetical protein
MGLAVDLFKPGMGASPVFLSKDPGEAPVPRLNLLGFGFCWMLILVGAEFWDDACTD